MVTTCEHCGRSFAAGRSSQRFCSRACAAVVRGQLLQRRELLICPVCGDGFEVGGRTGRRADRSVTCSLECAARARYRSGATAAALKPVDAAYLAGLLDGEGSIMLYLRRDVVAMRIAITNTHVGVLEWIVSKTEVGKVQNQYPERPSELNGREFIRKATYNWHCNADAAYSVLQQIRPFLKIKGEQADLAMETQDRLRVPGLKADRSWQNEYRLRMKELNRRGTAPLDQEG